MSTSKKSKKKKNKNKNKILVIDIESTGFLDNGGLIVEVGIVSLNVKNGKIKVLFDRVCREEGMGPHHTRGKYGWIFQNSDLTYEEVMAADTLESMKPTIQKIINKYPRGATAFNKKFDFGFLVDRGIVVPVEAPCIMLEAMNVCKIPGKYSRYKWPNVEEAWSIIMKTPYTEAHRGADDAKHEAQIAYAMISEGFMEV